MAGRPVAARGGGLTGLHYGLITFVILTVLALVMFVLQLTKNTDLETQATRANATLAKYGQPPAYYAEEADARRSNVFAVLDDDRRLMATMIVGKPDGVGKAVEMEVRTALGEIAKAHSSDRGPVVNENDTLVTAARRLSDALAAQRQAASAADERAKQLEAKNLELSEAAKMAEDTFTATITSLTERITAAESEKLATLSSKDEQVDSLSRELDKVTQDLQQFRTEVGRGEREKDLTIARLEKQVDALRKELEVAKPSAFDASKLLAREDGRVLRAIPGSDIVYVSLGEKDKLKVGMGFEVYSQTKEPQANLRGKASLEVLTLMSDTSECRVTRQTPGQPIVENDIVVNVAYDKTRKPKFLVLGDFDLDYDGQFDFEGADKIKAIIREWGGQTTETLDETTDYVVVGMSPQVPSLSGEFVSTVVRALADEKEIEKSMFKEKINEARSMHIPVMTQNAFLVLTGYSGMGSAEIR